MVGGSKIGKVYIFLYVYFFNFCFLNFFINISLYSLVKVLVFLMLNVLKLFSKKELVVGGLWVIVGIKL